MQSEAFLHKEVAAMSDEVLRLAWERSGRVCGDPIAHLLGAELLRRALGF